jgi:hypothetical protein
MTCNCNCGNSCGTCTGSRFAHRVVGATAGANFELTTTNSDNINDKDPYKFFANARIINNLPDTPLSVTVEVNGAQVPVWNKYGEQLLSSAIPRKAFGYYSATPTPHVILINTPETITIS